MSAVRRAMMAQGVSLVPFCDTDGKQIFTTLADGVVLEWGQFAPSIGEDAEFVYSESAIEGKFCGYNLGAYYSNGEIIFTGESNCNWLMTKAVPLGHVQYTLLHFFSGDNNSYRYEFCDNSGKTVSCSQNSWHTIQNLSTQIRSNMWGIYFLMTGSQWKFNNLTILDLTTIFTHHPNLLPTDAAAFKAMFWSEGTESDKQLGYTAYTAGTMEVVVKGGKLWIA